MSSKSKKDAVFTDRRTCSYRRSEYDLSRIGADRRRTTDRRKNHHAYADANWWLQVNYFDGHYMIRPGVKNTPAIFKSEDNLLKL